MSSLARNCVRLAAAAIWFAAIQANAADLRVSGVVKALKGQVVVVRGVQMRSLAVGDKIFFGDRILTRSGGAVGFSILNCDKTVTPLQSMLIDENVCGKSAVALVVPAAGSAFAPAAAGAFASSPSLLLPLLAANGGIATANALASSAAARPVSP